MALAKGTMIRPGLIARHSVCPCRVQLGRPCLMHPCRLVELVQLGPGAVRPCVVCAHAFQAGRRLTAERA